MLDRTAKGKRIAKVAKARRIHRRRQKRYRQRIAAGEIVAPVVINGHKLDLLIRLNWLKERAACDRNAIGDAISRMLDASG